MIYKLKDGTEIQAGAPVIFILKLKNSSKFDGFITIDEYMANFAQREKIYSGFDIDVSSYDNFINSLIGCGFLLEII